MFDSSPNCRHYRLGDIMNWVEIVLVVFCAYNILVATFALPMAKRVFIKPSDLIPSIFAVVLNIIVVLIWATPLTVFGLALMGYWIAGACIYVALALSGGMTVGKGFYIYGLFINAVTLILIVTLGITV